MNFPSVESLGDLSGKKVLVRVDWNVPVSQGAVDDFRIQASLPTVRLLVSKGAKVILATHLEGEGVSIEDLKKYLPSGVEILPNLRENPGEIANSEEFAKELAQKADLFVNEAFSVSHRSHASIVSVPRLLPSYAGIQFVKEVENLSRSFNPKHPLFLILGGAKFETKLPLVDKFLNIADEIFICGKNALPASQMSLAQNPRVSLPLGDITALDLDQDNLNLLNEKLERAKTVLWNGPVGMYEEGYKNGTLELAKMVAKHSADTIVGGADTLAAIKELNLYGEFSFVSTGGGAMLDFLANGTLPGIEALNSGSVGA